MIIGAILLTAARYWNSVPFRRAELPSAGALASSRGLAKVAGLLAGAGGGLLGAGTLASMLDKPSPGLTFGMRTFFTQVAAHYSPGASQLLTSQYTGRSELLPGRV